MAFSKVQQLMIEYGKLENVVDIDGDNFQATCPICHRDKKFYSNREGFCLCFRGCISGNVYTFFKLVCGYTYPQTKKLLKESNLSNTFTIQSNVVSRDTLFESLVALDNKPTNVLTMPELPTNTHRLLDDLGKPEILPYLKYLIDRGITEKQFATYDFRYCEQGVIHTRGNKELHIIKSIVFVAYKDGKPVYWNTRSILKNPFMKTFNAYAKENQYSKRDVVFNIDKVNPNMVTVICESVFNALTVSDNLKGLTGVATYGKVITDTQIRLILSKKPKAIYLGLDPDALNETYQLYKRLLTHGYPNDRIKLLQYPDKKRDINDLGRRGTLELIKQAKGYQESNMLTKILENNLR